MTFYRQVGQNIKKYRLIKNYSLQVLAEKVGVTKKTMQRYETGDIRVDMKGNFIRFYTKTTESKVIKWERDRWTGDLSRKIYVNSGRSGTICDGKNYITGKRLTYIWWGLVAADSTWLGAIYVTSRKNGLHKCPTIAENKGVKVFVPAKKEAVTPL